MKKTIITVFLILAALVLVLLIWELFFTDSGILHTVYNAMVGGINTVFTNFTGGNADAGDGLLPLWDSEPTGEYKDDDNGGSMNTFEIDNREGGATR